MDELTPVSARSSDVWLRGLIGREAAVLLPNLRLLRGKLGLLCLLGLLRLLQLLLNLRLLQLLLQLRQLLYLLPI